MATNQPFKKMTRPHTADLPIMRRKMTRFERWAWSPVVSFQLGLTGAYITMVYFGLSALIAKVPAFADTAPESWSSWWAVIVLLGAALSSLGSVSRACLFERIELVGATLLTLAVGSYAIVMLYLAYVEGDISRATPGAGFVVLTVPVLVRMLWLFSQSMRPRA